MNLKSVQEKLDELYKEELAVDILNNSFTLEQQEKISAPFLLKIEDNYLNADKKILYVGKETNVWWGKVHHFIQVPNAIEVLKQRYYAHFFGGEVIRSANFSEKKLYQAEKWRTPFFNEFSKVRKALLNNEKGSLVWSNLLKMDLDSGKGYSKNSKGEKAIVSISKKIFREEIKILKPDYIIFVTSHTYDKVIKEYFEDEIYDSNVIEKKSLWKFKIGNTTCYRTWHPSTIKYKSEKNKLEYFLDIIADIKEPQLF